jgi:L-threonylcarbamoyladenylate synthase
VVDVADILDVTGDGRGAAIERAAAALRDGELVVMPTDTVYGVAADAFSLDGTARLFRAKDRDRSVPLPVLLRSPKQLPGIAPDVPEVAERLMAAFWPGALTLVVPAEADLRWDLGRTQGTVAVRMPLDDVALEVIRAVGPLAVTSANRSGRPPAATAAAAEQQLGNAVHLYLDDGPREGGVASTIVDLTRRVPHVLRVGALDDELVMAVAEGELDPLEAADRVAEAELDAPPTGTPMAPEEPAGDGEQPQG